MAQTATKYNGSLLTPSRCACYHISLPRPLVKAGQSLLCVAWEFLAAAVRRSRDDNLISAHPAPESRTLNLPPLTEWHAHVKVYLFVTLKQIAAFDSARLAHLLTTNTASIAIECKLWIMQIRQWRDSSARNMWAAFRHQHVASP